MNRRNNFEIDECQLYTIIRDKYRPNRGFDDYFWMDLWAAKHIITDDATMLTQFEKNSISSCRNRVILF